MSLDKRELGIIVNGSFASAGEIVASLISSNTLEIEGEDVLAEVANTVAGLATQLARVREAAVIEFTKDAPEPKRGGGGPRKSGSTQGNDPATEKQVKLIGELVEQKQFDGDTSTDGLTKRQASALIDKLFAAPDLA